MSPANHISIDVQPCYLRSEQLGDNTIHLFRYTITIHNNSDQSIQLLERHWIITSGKHKEEVHGPGVLGEQPVIPPKGHFCYTSGVGLGSSSGEMKGSYLMTDTQNHLFQVTIPQFWLAIPSAIN